jgi:hypothetical protein
LIDLDRILRVSQGGEGRKREKDLENGLEYSSELIDLTDQVNLLGMA